MAWNPFGVSFEVSASSAGVTRTSATQYTVKIKAAWETYYSGAETNYGMKATSGGGSVTLNPSGTYASSGSGSFTGTYSISGNGSATKTITVTFTNYIEDWQGNVTDSKTTTVTFNVTVPAWISYTVSYNANGGSGAPSSQTKWKDQTLTLHSTKPTRTGYTFKGWGTSSTDTSVDYAVGATVPASVNKDLPLYAIWAENVLTVNYYSNYATEAFADALNTVGSDKNVIVRTATYLYDNEYTNGHWDYSYSGASTYLGRIGYTGTGYWGTSTSGGTLVSQSASYSTGQALAEAVGKSLKTGNASVNLYAQWSENKLTVEYYSNYADYGTYKGEALNVSADTNVLVHSQDFLYDNSYSSALSNVQNPDYLYLSRIGYAPTGYWCTTITGGNLVDEDANYTGQALAEALGKDISNESATVKVYPQWKPSGVVYIDNGTTLEPYLIYVDNGTSWDLYLAYVDSGTEWNIIS